MSARASHNSSERGSSKNSRPCQAAGVVRVRRSRSAAYARQARMSSVVSCGKSARIWLSDMPPANSPVRHRRRCGCPGRTACQIGWPDQSRFGRASSWWQSTAIAVCITVPFRRPNHQRSPAAVRSRSSGRPVQRFVRQPTASLKISSSRDYRFSMLTTSAVRRFSLGPSAKRSVITVVDPG